MKHIELEQMQRFLADEIDLIERDSVAEHLACCDQCAALLAQVTADDELLAGALRLDDEEKQWLELVDLTEPVLQKIRPWYREPAAIAIGLLALVPPLFFLSRMVPLLVSSLWRDGSTFDLLSDLVPALWHLNLYLGRGGLLVTMWPALVLAAILWFVTARTKKEAPDHA